MNRALSFPTNTVAHVAREDVAGELADLLALELAGVPLELVALPEAVEDSLYRFNNLPVQLAALYADVDPLDPDEDVLEEAEEPALALVGQAYLLDEVIDAVYDAIAGLPDALTVRRPDTERGEDVRGKRAALLALKALVKRDWRYDSVMERLERTASVAIDARPVLFHPSDGRPDPALSARASEVLGRRVAAFSRDGSLTSLR